MRLENTALLDQADAATRHAVKILGAIAASDNGSRYRRGTPGPVMTAVVRKLTGRASSGRLTLCGHLSWAAPQPAFWTAWAPGRLRCAYCTETVQHRIRGTREDRRCDHCRAVTRRIHPDRVQLPAIVLDEAEPRCLPPVIAIFGLCPDCHRADIAGTEQP